MGMLRAVARKIGRMVDWDGVVRNWKWIVDGGRLIDPRKYPWSRRGEWACAPKNPDSFRQSMARGGVDEAMLSRIHGRLAVSSWIATVGAGSFIGLGIHYAAHGAFGGVLAAIGMSAAAGACAFVHSFRAFQLRRRDLNLGVGEFLADPWSIIPPYRIGGGK